MDIALRCGCILGFAAVIAYVAFRTNKFFEYLFGDSPYYIGHLVFATIGAAAASFVPIGPPVAEVPMISIAIGAVAGIYVLGGAAAMAMK